MAGDKPVLIGRSPLALPPHRAGFYGSGRGGLPYPQPMYSPFARPPVQGYRFRGGRGGRFGGVPYRPGYVDLDAPPEDLSLNEQRTAIDYGDLDAVPEPPPSIAIDTSTASAVTADDTKISSTDSDTAV